MGRGCRGRAGDDDGAIDGGDGRDRSLLDAGPRVRPRRQQPLGPRCARPTTPPAPARGHRTPLRAPSGSRLRRRAPAVPEAGWRPAQTRDLLLRRRVSRRGALDGTALPDTVRWTRRPPDRVMNHALDNWQVMRIRSEGHIDVVDVDISASNAHDDYYTYPAVRIAGPGEHAAAAGDRVRHRGDGRRSGRRRRRRHVRGLRGLGQQPQPLAARPLLRVAVRGVRVRVLPRGRLARAAPDPRDRELGLRVPGDRVPRERRAARRGQPVREQPRAPAPRHHRPRSLRVHEHDRDHRQHLPQQPRVRPGGGGRIQPSGRLLRAQATSGAIAVVEGATRRPRRGGGWRRARRGRGRRPRQRQQTAPRPTARRRRPPRPRPR